MGIDVWIKKQDISLTLDEYELAAMKTAQYPNLGNNLVYPAMGIAGEGGEFCDKVKKRWRNTGHMDDTGLFGEDRTQLLMELGDVLWYITACARELGMTLEEVAKLNLEKLAGRRERGTIKGVGDNR